MLIQEMFADDINRKIGGVVKVDQDEIETVKQEVREYVVTRELKNHFDNFFNYYLESFSNPCEDTSVWISGFFGSGKSHFLKMLSYLLENKRIGDTSTVELFRDKFEQDSDTFSMIEQATAHPTETILFNIDIVSGKKSKESVRQAFVKMFYEHLGFSGENCQLAMLGRRIEENGKLTVCRRLFQE